ncbi:MAG: transposase, partial [Methanoculleus sp.]
HPHNVRKSAKRLRRAQRKLSRAVKGSRNRRKQRVTVARIHERIENRRDDFLHTWSRYYVDRYHLIALEHLNIRPMVESLDAKLRGRSKSFLDAAMGRRAGAGEAGGFESRGTRQESSYATKLRMLVSMSTLLIRPTRPRTVSSAGTAKRRISRSEPIPARSAGIPFREI